MAENRRLDRRRDTCRVGLVHIAANGPAHECLVWDLSEHGALIEFEHDGLPDRFTLTVAPMLSSRPCLVLRRETRRYAVVFQAADGSEGANVSTSQD